MTAFEVFKNGRRLCTAGVGSCGILAAHVTWTKHDAAHPPGCCGGGAEREEFHVSISGLVNKIHSKWPMAPLQPGDEVLIRICETEAIDAPAETRTSEGVDPVFAQQNFVRQMCQQWGWKLTETTQEN